MSENYQRIFILTDVVYVRCCAKETQESMQNTANAFFVLFQAHLKKWIEVITTGSTQSQQVAAKTSHSPEDVSQFAGREIKNYRVRCPSMNPLLK